MTDQQVQDEERHELHIAEANRTMGLVSDPEECRLCEDQAERASQREY